MRFRRMFASPRTSSTVIAMLVEHAGRQCMRVGGVCGSAEYAGSEVYTLHVRSRIQLAYKRLWGCPCVSLSPSTLVDLGSFTA
jgi:hypothetical protein